MVFWFQRGMAFLPIFLVVWTYLTFMTSYIIAVSRGDVDPGFPYISDTGARRPESSIFGQMLNISAVAALACLYIRYKQVDGYLEKLEMTKFNIVNRLNKIGMFFSVLICLGISLVANFQETSVLYVHLVGAMLAFGLGTLYEFLQTYITYKMHPEVNGRRIFHARLAVCVVSLMAFVGGFIATSCTTAVNKAGDIKFHWKPGQPGYSAHLASTILEWVLAGSFLAYFFTFIRDFQQITIGTNTELHHETLYHDGVEQLHDEREDGDIVA
uniref:DNA damage-regulated autophagy modulator protein 2 n=1 Tax=Ciona intestinalis TaxID=7719 RepID=H2XXE6_CIOIN|nr:DNA damage-regulated autophagy modulator protein 2 [Ciona intestinalis]|eukprot:XP_026692660.1 DNA damage-regulated autophagy modulator protein 2 [Ciona intestinalis]